MLSLYMIQILTECRKQSYITKTIDSGIKVILKNTTLKIITILVGICSLSSIIHCCIPLRLMDEIKKRHYWCHFGYISLPYVICKDVIGMNNDMTIFSKILKSISSYKEFLFIYFIYIILIVILGYSLFIKSMNFLLKLLFFPAIMAGIICGFGSFGAFPTETRVFVIQIIAFSLALIMVLIYNIEASFKNIFLWILLVFWLGLLIYISKFKDKEYWKQI